MVYMLQISDVKQLIAIIILQLPPCYNTHCTRK